MNIRRFVVPLTATFLLIGCEAAEDIKGDRAADIVLRNGAVKTSDGWESSLAITGSEILAVGSEAQMSSVIGAQTRVIDLEGRVVLPGFHDRHVHPLYGGMIYSGADYTNCAITQGSSVVELQVAVAECLTRVQPGDWLTGGQWDASALGGVPDKAILDKVSVETPILLFDTSGHSMLANSKALEVAQIGKSTPNPDGGIIERDALGEPTGVLRETAGFLARALVPPPSDKILYDALSWSLDTMLSHGITSFTEASNGFVAGSRREIELYARLADDGVLKQRVRVCLNWAADSPGDATAEVIADRLLFARPNVSPDCIKLFLDGVPTDSHTAAMLDPYADSVAGRDDDASRYGLLLIEQDILNHLVSKFDADGLTVKFHAAGDAAVRAGLDAIESARKANGDSGLRHNVGHVTFISSEDLHRPGELGATLELSPYLWAPSPINQDITAAVGETRIERVWPFREVIDAGNLVVAGSDWAVVPSVNPWLAVEMLVTREVAGGGINSFGKKQSITVEEAIALFTNNAAAHMGEENVLGELKPGYLADLIVLDQNPYTVPVSDLHKTSVDMTFIGGDLVYQRR